MHDPFDLGGYAPIPEPVQLGAELTFASPDARRCTINAASLVLAFLELDADGLIPDVGKDWRAGLQARAKAACAGEPAHLARYWGLARHIEGICQCCGAECHGIWRHGEAEFAIERWSITHSVLALIEARYLPALPIQWHVSLERDYERIRETGQRVSAASQGGAGNV